MIKLLALDVAFTNIGWAVIAPYTDGAEVLAVGTIKNPSDAKKKKSIRDSDLKIERCRFVYRSLVDLVYDNDVKGIVAEIPGGGGKSHKATAGMAMGTCLISCAVEQVGLPADWTTESDGKMCVCRNKGASKLDMQKAILKMYPETRKLVPKSDKARSGVEGWFEHAADAIAAFEAAKRGAVVSMLSTLNGAKGS